MTANLPPPGQRWAGLISFGRQLLETLDLDPVYVILYEGRRAGLMDAARLKRWCIAYWLFYHAGVASELSKYRGRTFWTAMGADMRKLPRGSERRHFRGSAAKGAIEKLTRQYPEPEGMVDHAATGYNFNEVTAIVKGWPLFGPWAAFKVADMLERVLGVPVDFADCDLSFYSEPAKAVELVQPGGTVRGVVDQMIAELGGYFAPPAMDRPVGIAECETMMCKSKSHWFGHYPMGKDSREVLHALHGWGELAEGLVQFVPKPLPAIV